MHENDAGESFLQSSRISLASFSNLQCHARDHFMLFKWGLFS